jgi:hypothetical protein
MKRTKEPRTEKSLNRKAAQLQSGNDPAYYPKKVGWRNKNNYNSNPICVKGHLMAGNKQKYHKYKK